MTVISMRCCFTYAIAFLGFTGAILAAVAVSPGERPPPEILANVRPAMEAGRRALAAQDAAAVRVAVERAIAALGPWAGNPETATRYFPPVDRAPFEAAKLREWWLSEIARGRRGLPWLKNPAGDPRVMQAGLREAAWPLDGLARTAQLFPEHRDDLTKEVRAGADWLIKRQHPSGVFPFPIGPGLNPREKVGHIVARIIKEYPDSVVNDWIPDDRTDGGLQFDNGLCGRALISAFELTKEARYLDAARKAGDWAVTRPLVANWNYNAFSVGLLARLATATGEAKYLDAAIKKADSGVLPGQMTAGRWFDAHNACAVYHNILLRELLELYRALPDGHAFRSKLSDALRRGLNQAAEETLTHGYTGTWTDNFARALQLMGENEKWRDALNTNVNASGKNGAPKLGFAVIPVLESIATAAAAPASGEPQNPFGSRLKSTLIRHLNALLRSDGSVTALKGKTADGSHALAFYLMFEATGEPRFRAAAVTLADDILRDMRATKHGVLPIKEKDKGGETIVGGGPPALGAYVSAAAYVLHREGGRGRDLVYLATVLDRYAWSEAGWWASTIDIETGESKLPISKPAIINKTAAVAMAAGILSGFVRELDPALAARLKAKTDKCVYGQILPAQQPDGFWHYSLTGNDPKDKDVLGYFMLTTKELMALQRFNPAYREPKLNAALEKAEAFALRRIAPMTDPNSGRSSASPATRGTPAHYSAKDDAKRSFQLGLILFGGAHKDEGIKIVDAALAHFPIGNAGQDGAHAAEPSALIYTALAVK